MYNIPMLDSSKKPKNAALNKPWCECKATYTMAIRLFLGF
jgi:hypothetical protein